MRLRHIILLLCLSWGLNHAVQAQHSYSTSNFRLTLDVSGLVKEMTDLNTDRNYAIPEPFPLITVRIKEVIESPIGFSASEGSLSYEFPEGVKVELEIINQGDYLRLEVKKIKADEDLDALIWGPFKTTITGTIGEFVGVVRNRDFAIGIQALNVKTTGGALVDEQGYVAPRGSTALEQEYGSSLQAFCIDRTISRTMEVWNGFQDSKVVANPDFGIEGSALALFGIHPEEALGLIGRIELAEGLPHMMIEGEWVKASPLAGRPYIISGFGENTIDMMLDFTEKVGFYSLYQSHPFENWGHFDLIPSLFPSGRAGMKACVEEAKERNILLGVHTLTNFITTNDPFITPLPHEGLATFAPSSLDRDIGAEDAEIPITDTSHYHRKTALQTIRIGDELIRFSGVSKESPFRLLNCQRGAFQTQATKHKKGASVARLIDHPYKTFYPDMNLQNEMIDNLIDFFNETGVSHMDFDGHEGAYSTGYGDASKDYFALRFLEGVDHMVVNGTSQSSHYYWHLNTYMNWGEPWYGGMRESQNDIRFNNQATLERNYQPNMLGWFWFQTGTTLEEMEWMLARAAGWNAGYALVVNPIALGKSLIVPEVIDAIRTWEEAKERKIFNEEQIKLLKAGENDFSLYKISENEFHLQYYKKELFSHENIVLQPGQPHYSTWEFHKPEHMQEFSFKLSAPGSSGTIEEIRLELDASKVLDLPLSLKAGYSCVYNEGGKLLLYDQNGTLKKVVDPGWGELPLGQANHTLQVSCTFSMDSDQELKGIITVKDKIDEILVD